MLNYNPINTNGFDFIEFTSKSPQELVDLFTKFGFVITRRHVHKNLLLLEQGEIKFLINSEPQTQAAAFEAIHGSGICGMSFRVANSQLALQEAVKRGAKAVTSNDYDLPAIEGVGGSKIYLIDEQTSEAFFAKTFEFTGQEPLAQPILTYIDHLTHNVFRGNMEAWGRFYEQVFNFREIRYFDIKGKHTALTSKAIVSPCGKIRIPLNESQDELSQIAEFLERYNGEGIQHLALGCENIYNVISQIKAAGIVFQETPETYYDLIPQRIPQHQEDITALKEMNILIDGEGYSTLLQIFTKEIIGPIFFELIERKGNPGFGEGNFQALFESIELDQIRRGVINDQQAEELQPVAQQLKHPMLLNNSTTKPKVRAKSRLTV
ncbi:4-hydroxyphenylpyruvate dioxygenase [Chondrocystis sp. NIES-4102]|nr:4-hydroxyphenylpyruvate dioxygenase [Chondrocystis sp. NIES-4102]